MQITKTWLELNRTLSGSFTRAQINELGLDYPPSRGWMRRLEGSEISEESMLRFELKSNTFSGVRSKCALEKAVILVCRKSSELTENQIKRLRSI